MARHVDELLRAIAAGPPAAVYLVQGDLVVAEPQAARLAEALAAKAGCAVERHRRPATLAPILADLKTFSLFASSKVVLVVDAAILADETAAADLVDQAGDAPTAADGGLSTAGREGASRLLQALHVFGLDPRADTPAGVIDALPKWALQGGRALRKKKPRGRPAKEVKALRDHLVELLGAALDAGLVGFAEGDLAELGAIVSGGLPPGHALVLAEDQVAAEHPLVKALVAGGNALLLGKVAADRGAWQGLEPLVAELERECGVKIARDAVAELARRTLKQTGDFKDRQVDSGSTSRFAAELRKLASLAGEGTISRQLVVSAVEDRGEQDVFQIFDALGEGRGGDALARLRRYLAAADDATAARLSFFALLGRFCRELVAVAGVVPLVGAPWGERNYQRFKERLAPRLQGELPQGFPSPLAGVHPFKLHRSYLTASAICRSPTSRAALAELPAWVLETELRLKGEASDGDAALTALVARLVQLVRA